MCTCRYYKPAEVSVFGKSVAFTTVSEPVVCRAVFSATSCLYAKPVCWEMELSGVRRLFMSANSVQEEVVLCSGLVEK